MMQVDDIGLFMPTCIVRHLTGNAKDSPYLLDTTVYHIETGVYVRAEIMPLVKALKAIDEAIASATADYLTSLGVRVERNYICVPENDGNVLPFVKMGNQTAQDYAKRVRLSADEQIASTSIVRTWHHTPVGWLVTNETDNLTGGEYCYGFRMPELTVKCNSGLYEEV